MTTTAAPRTDDWSLTANPKIHPLIDSWTYNPSSAEKVTHKPGFETLKTIRAKLPHRDVPEYAGQIGDYPGVPELLTENWHTVMSDGRDLFVINGVTYFRRYNDEWNTLIMAYGLNGMRSWQSISHEDFDRLAKSL